MQTAPNSIEFISILVSISGLLGFVIHKVVNHFIASDKEKNKYIETLVASNQRNTADFLNAVNHQQTMNREMQGKTNEAISSLKSSIETNNQINNRLMDWVKEKSKQ